MDLASVLAYKSLFLANRGKNTLGQVSDGQSYTAAANATRCAISASQAVIPLFAVSRCLSSTATATAVANSNLQKIAMTMTSDTTKSALNSISGMTKFLSKLGLIGNISYAVAKCLDAKEEEKGKTFMKAGCNLGCMYLFENVYSRCVDKIKPDTITKGADALAKNAGKLKFLKSVKPVSIIIGIGFVAASLLGCWTGDKLGESIHTAFTNKSDKKVDYTA